MTNLTIIDRTAVIITPKEPFWDWVNKTFPEDKLDPTKVEEARTVFLVPSFEFNDDAIEYIKGFYDEIFEEELSDWCTDESTWPPNRTWNMFRKWFDIEIDSMVFDTAEEPIIKEEYYSD